MIARRMLRLMYIVKNYLKTGYICYKLKIIQSFWFPSAPGADPVPQLSKPKFLWERAGLPGVLTHLRAQVRPPLLLKYSAQEGPSWSPQDTGTEEQPETRCFQNLSASGADLVPQLSIPKSHQERTGLPGVLTHRLTGGTSHSQRQKDQKTPQKTRWQEAGTRI